jgi:hypothetical protein
LNPFLIKAGSHQKIKMVTVGITANGATLVPPNSLESKVKLLIGRKNNRVFQKKVNKLSERIIIPGNPS